MLVNKYLKAGEVDDINQAGRFFKVISSETELRVRVTNGAEVLIDSIVTAGFDVQTSKEFTLIQVISEQPQKVQLWVSEHKLGYDALTNGSNVNQSTLIEHYGGEQKILPVEKTRVAVTLFSDSEPFWYGGEGVTMQNGMPVKAGVPCRIEGAGELHLAINKAPEILPNGVQNEVSVPGSSYYDSTIRWVCAVGDYIYFSSEVDKKVYYLRGGVVGEVLAGDGVTTLTDSKAATVRDGVLYIAWESGKIVGVVAARGVVSYNVSVTGNASGIAVVDGGLMVLTLRNHPQQYGLAVFDGVSYQYTFDKGPTGAPSVFSDESGRIFVNSGGVYVFNSVADIPALKADAVKDSRFYQFDEAQENENFVLLMANSINPSVTAMNKKTGAVIKSPIVTSQICAAQDGFLYALDGPQLKRSSDGAVWVTVVSGLEVNPASNVMLMAGIDMASFPRTKGQWEGIKIQHYEMSPQQNTPRAKIRMLKEVV